MSNIPAKFTQPCGSIYFLDFLGERRGQIDRILHMNLYAHKYTKEVASCIFQNQNHVVYQYLLHKSVAIYIYMCWPYSTSRTIVVSPLFGHVCSKPGIDGYHRHIGNLRTLTTPRRNGASKIRVTNRVCPLKKEGRSVVPGFNPQCCVCFKLDPGIAMYNVKILYDSKKKDG